MLGVKANVKSLVVRIQTATTATLKQPPGTSLDDDASSDRATGIVALHDRVARQVEGVSETYATFFVFVEFTLVLLVLSFGSAAVEFFTQIAEAGPSDEGTEGSEGTEVTGLTIFYAALCSVFTLLMASLIVKVFTLGSDLSHECAALPRVLLKLVTALRQSGRDVTILEPLLEVRLAN